MLKSMANAEIAAAGIDCVDLERLRDLAKQATPGPWEQKTLTAAPNCFKSRIMKDGNTVAVVKTERSDMHRATGWGSTKDIRERDAAYIAAANPQVVLALIERIEELEKENAKNRTYWLAAYNVIDDYDKAISWICLALGLKKAVSIDLLYKGGLKQVIERIKEIKARYRGLLRSVDSLANEIDENDKIADEEEARLEKQLDWLAAETARIMPDCEADMKHAAYWREAAREAVENAMKEKCNE